MYFNRSATSKVLSVLKNLGFSAEAIGASRPRPGVVLYKVVVQAPWLPKLRGEVQTTDLCRPEHLHGYGAAIADINQVEKLNQSFLA